MLSGQYLQLITLIIQQQKTLTTYNFFFCLKLRFNLFAATIAAQNGKPVYKYKTWRVKGQVIPEVLEQYKSVSTKLFATYLLIILTHVCV